MCKIILVPNDNESILYDKTRMFSHLLNLSVELSEVEAAPQAEAIPCDILLIEKQTEPSVDGDVCPSDRSRHVITVSDRVDHAEYAPEKGVLPSDWSLRNFYDLLLSYSPKTVAAVDPDCLKRRWYGNNSYLQQCILEVISLIKREYNEDLGLDYLAEKVHFSPCYLSSIFNKFMGESAPSYLNNYRMQIAQKYLKETDLTLADISERVGYNNLPYFCTIFKRIYGMTPTQYRLSAAS